MAHLSVRGWMSTIFILLSIQGSSAQCPFGTVSNGTHCLECGLTDIQPNIKIVGGTDAVPNSWPSQAFIHQIFKDIYSIEGNDYTFSTGFQCGGTIISNNVVLTAAHCIAKSFTETVNKEDYILSIAPNQFYPTWESMFTVYLGVQDNSQMEPSAKAFEVKKIILHPNYDDNTLLNDIAIFILKTPITFNTYMKPACLPPKDLGYPYPFTDLFVSGWGNTQENGNTADILQNVKLKTFPNSACSNVHPELPKDWNRQFCGGLNDSLKDTCQGDSGGGMITIDTSTNVARRLVAGVVSYGEGCARGKPGIYARVSFYLDWIYQYMPPSPVTTTKSTTTMNPTTTTPPRGFFQGLINFFNSIISFFKKLFGIN